MSHTLIDVESGIIIQRGFLMVPDSDDHQLNIGVAHCFASHI